MATGSPNFAITPRVGVGLAATGDTSLTAPVSRVTVLAAGASGSRIERIVLTAVGATTATTLRLFIYNGATYSLWKEIIVPAVAPSAGAIPVWSYTLEAVTTPNLMPLLLPSGSSLVASINNTQTSSGVNVFAIGGDF